MLLKVTFSEDEMTLIHQARGGVPAATWVRTQIMALVGGKLPVAAEPSPPKAERSPTPPSKEEAINLGRQILGKPPLQRPIIQKKR